MSVRPSVRPSVGRSVVPSVGPSVTSFFFGGQKRRRRTTYFTYTFLVVSHDSIRGCVRPSVRRSVRRSVRNLFFGGQKRRRQTTYAVHPALFLYRVWGQRKRLVYPVGNFPHRASLVIDSCLGMSTLPARLSKLVSFRLLSGQYSISVNVPSFFPSTF